jgi:two-component system, NarL family, nitrate/nitrite response regulator NarL
VRLVLGDDHRLFAEPVAAALTRRGHDVVIATNVAGAVEAVGEHAPDLCLMDLRFPDGNGLDAVTAMRDRFPACPVVVLSGSDDAHASAAAAAAGAVGFLSKAQPLAAIFEALDRIAAGKELEPRSSPRAEYSDDRSRARDLVAGLTERERQVLRRLVEGDDTVAIARSLGIAVSTARTHLQSVITKLGVHSRMQAVALVVGTGTDVEW